MKASIVTRLTSYWDQNGEHVLTFIWVFEYQRIAPKIQNTAKLLRMKENNLGQLAVCFITSILIHLLFEQFM